MIDLSVLVGGKAGDGINSAGLVVSHLLNRRGYHTYMYFDYPSLIKGGHNFTITRAAEHEIGSVRDRVDYILALNQDSVDLHKDLVHPGTVVVYDSSKVKTEGQGIDIPAILKSANAPPVMANSCIIGAFAGVAGIPETILEEVLKKQVPKGIEQNLLVARRAYEAVTPARPIPQGIRKPSALVTGNEAIGIGLLAAGLDAFVAYPMTPTSNLLHFLAGAVGEVPITVVHPENEIAVILMAHGLAYAGKRAAVGTSGGGFCLMTEAFSMAGMNEVPVVVVMGQRTGPSTGLPTYSGQTELHFMLHAGQGEFPRLVVAPGDPAQAVYWSGMALTLAWKCQVPAIVLVDKTICEGTYPLPDDLPVVPEATAVTPEGDGGPYRRYAMTDNGVSPVLFPPSPGAVVKVNSYAHDEDGITTERADLVNLMTEKRLRKSATLKRETDNLPAVQEYGKPDAKKTLLCWGSTVLTCREVADTAGLRVVQPVVLEPFPKEALARALQGAGPVVAVEENALGQLQMLCARNGIPLDAAVRKYDGRPFSVEELAGRVREVA